MNTYEFHQFIPSQLTSYMESMGFHKTYDNSELVAEDKRTWIFKIIFKGPIEIEISNVDWRDYTEDFNIYFNSIQVGTINIEEYESLDSAYLALTKLINRYFIK